MTIKLGTHVRTTDDQDAGTIDRLVVDPITTHIKATIIHQGWLLGRAVEVPIDRLTVDPDGAARLTLTAKQVEDLPDFVEANYTSIPPSGYVPPPNYPLSSLVWPVGYGLEPGAPLVDMVLDEGWRRHDIEKVLGEGGEVRTSDGEKVGSIHHLAFDPDKGVLTRIVIRSGFIFTNDTEVPASFVARVDDGVIQLRVDAAWFRLQRELEPGRQVWTNDVSLLGTIDRLDGGDLLVVSLDRTRWARVPIDKLQSQNGQVVVDLTNDEVARMTVQPATDPATEYPNPAA